MNYYQFNIGDYIGHTAHLDPLEDIAYRRLLDLYYQSESPIPNETQMVSKRIRMVSHEDLVGSVLAEFFELRSDGMWHQARCDKEISAYKAKAEANRMNGKKGGRPRNTKPQPSEAGEVSPNPQETQSVISGIPQITLNKKQETRTINQDIKSMSEPASPAQPKPEKAAALPRFTDEDMQAAVWIFNTLLKTFPATKRPNLSKWADHVRLMREVDGKSHREVCNLFQFANRDSFWASNIMSPAKLRDKWDQLEAKRISAAQPGNNASGRMSGVRDYTAGVNQDGSF